MRLTLTALYRLIISFFSGLEKYAKAFEATGDIALKSVQSIGEELDMDRQDAREKYLIERAKRQSELKALTTVEA